MTSYSRHEAALDGKQARNQWQAFHMLEDTDLLMNSSDATTTKKTSTSLFVLGPDEEDGGGADEVGGAEEEAGSSRREPSLKPVEVFLSSGRSRMLTFGRRGAVNGSSHHQRPVAAALRENSMRPSPLVFHKQTEFCHL